MSKVNPDVSFGTKGEVKDTHRLEKYKKKSGVRGDKGRVSKRASAREKERDMEREG